MPNAHLLRNEAPLPNVLKLKGGMKCMSAKTFAKQKGAMLPQLRTRTDPPPRLMRPGVGEPTDWHAQVRALLQQPDATPVRGFRLYKLSIDNAYWGEPAWLAITHVVVATVSMSGNVVYTDPTRSEDEPYIFVPSDRAHRDLSTEQLLSGRWLTGCVVGGHPRFCHAFVISERLSGRQRGIIATSPEGLVAKPNVKVRPMPHFDQWYRERGFVNGMETQAELMGAAVYDVDADVTNMDALAAYHAMSDNPEAYTSGVLALKLELKCQSQLMRGEVGVDEVRELFFALYDSCAQLVRAEQTRRLLAQLEEHGFNTLYG